MFSLFALCRLETLNGYFLQKMVKTQMECQRMGYFVMVCTNAFQLYDPGDIEEYSLNIFYCKI